MNCGLHSACFLPFTALQRKEEAEKEMTEKKEADEKASNASDSNSAPVGSSHLTADNVDNEGHALERKEDSQTEQGHPSSADPDAKEQERSDEEVDMGTADSLVAQVEEDTAAWPLASLWIKWPLLQANPSSAHTSFSPPPSIETLSSDSVDSLVVVRSLCRHLSAVYASTCLASCLVNGSKSGASGDLPRELRSRMLLSSIRIPSFAPLTATPHGDGLSVDTFFDSIETQLAAEGRYASIKLA